MVIVINTMGASNLLMVGLGEAIRRAIAIDLSCSFIILEGQNEPPIISAAPNVTRHQVAHNSNNSLLQQAWERWMLPQLLKKLGAALLVNANGKCCLQTSLPQILLLPDEAVSGKTKRLARHLEKATLVGVCSAFAKAELQHFYQCPADKVAILYPSVPAGFRSLSWEEKAAVKEEFTSGKEFFLYSGPITTNSNLVNLLKAFSLFKKRQQSNLQLVFAGENQWPQFAEKLSTYKFRVDTRIVPPGDENQLTRLTGAAYACINPLAEQGFSTSQLAAMKCGVPVITVAEKAEPGGPPVLLADVKEPSVLAERMKLLYKDEHMRSELILKGFAESEKYDPSLVAATIWDCLQRAVKQH